MGKTYRQVGENPPRRNDFTKKRHRQQVSRSLRSFTSPMVDEDEFGEWFDKLTDDDVFEPLEPIRKRR